MKWRKQLICCPLLGIWSSNPFSPPSIFAFIMSLSFSRSFLPACVPLLDAHIWIIHCEFPVLFASKFCQSIIRYSANPFEWASLCTCIVYSLHFAVHLCTVLNIQAASSRSSLTSWFHIRQINQLSISSHVMYILYCTHNTALHLLLLQLLVIWIALSLPSLPSWVGHYFSSWNHNLSFSF